MPESELDGIYRDTVIGPIEMRYDADRWPDERCAEATVDSMRTSSKTAAKGYLAAAQWFALAAAK